MADVAFTESFIRTLTSMVQVKVNELGWGAGADNSDLAEYIILMLSSGKDQPSIREELAIELLGLETNDPDVTAFTSWLFRQCDMLKAQASGGPGPASSAPRAETSPATSVMGTNPGVSVPANTARADVDTAMTGVHPPKPEIVTPTGPRSMRNGNLRGGREKRMVGTINRILDRSHDSVLHRVRGNGNERINTHNRNPPAGPRGNQSRLNRSMNGRAANIAHVLAAQDGLNGMNSMNSHCQQAPPGMNINGNPWMMGGSQGSASQDPNQIRMVAMIEQQSRLIQQLHHQQQQLMINNQQNRSGYANRGQRNGSFRGGSHHQADGRHGQKQDYATKGDAPTDGEDMDISQPKQESQNPEETVCKYNTRCTNKDCKFVHQSPAAPAGIAIDMNDVCTFGVACKNKKCVGKHPSPAAKAAHQSEQDCKFYPNCQNPHCPFRHPPPICRNGGDCSVPNCKFTHLETICKYRPCTNRFCKFKHEEGQRGTFQDKVWVAGGADSRDHVSERKFVDETALEETVMADDGRQDHDIAL